LAIYLSEVVKNNHMPVGYIFEWSSEKQSHASWLYIWVK